MTKFLLPRVTPMTLREFVKLLNGHGFKRYVYPKLEAELYEILDGGD